MVRPFGSVVPGVDASELQMYMTSWGSDVDVSIYAFVRECSCNIGLSVQGSIDGEHWTTLDTFMENVPVFGTNTGREHSGPKVPVRRGGPWNGDGSLWEVWRNGVKVNNNVAFRVHAGELEFRCNGTWFVSSSSHDLDEIELRAPKDYDGPVPEGCVWAYNTEGVISDVRVSSKALSAEEVLRAANEGKVPIRLGGPWDRGDSYWEVWRNGGFHQHSEWAYRVHLGVMECLYPDSTWKPPTWGVIPPGEAELHAPKGWPKPSDEVPEGCYVLNPPVEEVTDWCKTCGRRNHVSSGCTPSIPYPVKQYCWEPKDKPDEGKFKVGDRVKDKLKRGTGTVVGFVPNSTDRTVQWDCKYKNESDLQYLVTLPESEDPLPRKAGVIVYEVTKEEYEKGYNFVHKSGNHYWSARRADGPGGTNRTEEGCTEYFCGHASVGQTWIICQE